MINASGTGITTSFVEVLRTRLTEEQPDQLPILHQRASDWFESNNLPADAVHHALAAEDFMRAAGLIELAWPVMDSSCQTATWLGWVKVLPEEMVFARPVLNVGYAWALLSGGKMEAGEKRLQDAEQWLDTTSNMSEGLPSTGMIVVDEEQFQSLPGINRQRPCLHCPGSRRCPRYPEVHPAGTRSLA